jgi:sporulation protein YlmC with PRC-barrel domain
MRTKSFGLLIAVVSVCLVIRLFANDNKNEERQKRDAAETHIFQRTRYSVDAAKVSQLLDHEIRDSSGNKIGRVREIALDLRNGRIAEIIVGSGGFLGIEEKDTAVPPAEFVWDPQTKKLACQLDEEHLRNAPGFDLSRWADSTTPGKIREVYNRYNVAPYFVDERTQTRPASEIKPAIQLTSAEMAAPTLHLGSLERTRGVIYAAVQNQRDEHVGRVENVIVDFAVSRIVVLIVSTGDYLGMGNEVSAVPAQVFHYDTDTRNFRISADQDTLRTAPHFKPDQWPAVATEERIAMVYDAYSVPSYRSTFDVVNAAQNVRDRTDSASGAAFDQTTSASDRAITARIRREIMLRPELSVDAQNLKITTQDGHVTLRGPVKNKAEEQTILEIAKNAVTQNARVTNEIRATDERNKPKSNQSPSDPD